MIVTQARSPYRLRLCGHQQCFGCFSSFGGIWSAGSTEPPGKTHHRVEREGVGLAECCQEAHWDAETVGFLLLLKRLSVSTRYHVVGSSLPLEPQEVSTDHSRTHAHFMALLSCKGTCAPQKLWKVCSTDFSSHAKANL